MLFNNYNFDEDSFDRNKVRGGYFNLSDYLQDYTEKTDWSISAKGGRKYDLNFALGKKGQKSRKSALNNPYFEDMQRLKAARSFLHTNLDLINNSGLGREEIDPFELIKNTKQFYSNVVKPNLAQKYRSFKSSFAKGYTAFRGRTGKEYENYNPNWTFWEETERGLVPYQETAKDRAIDAKFTQHSKYKDAFADFVNTLKSTTQTVKKLFGIETLFATNEKGRLIHEHLFPSMGRLAGGVISSLANIYTSGQIAQGNIGAGLAGTIVGNGYDIGSRASLVTMNMAQMKASQVSSWANIAGTVAGGIIGGFAGGGPSGFVLGSTIGSQLATLGSGLFNAGNLSSAQRLASSQQYLMNNALQIAGIASTNAFGSFAVSQLNPNHSMTPMALAAIRGISPTASMFGPGIINSLANTGAKWLMDYSGMASYANSLGYLSSVGGSIGGNNTMLSRLAYSNGLSLGSLASSASNLIPLTQGNVGNASTIAASIASASPGYGGLIQGFASSAYVNKFTNLLLAQSFGIPYQAYMDPSSPNNASARKFIRDKINSFGVFGEKDPSQAILYDYLGLNPGNTDYTNPRGASNSKYNPALPSIMDKYLKLSDNINDSNLSGSNLDVDKLQGQLNSLVNSVKNTVSAFDGIKIYIDSWKAGMHSDKSNTRPSGATTSSKH